MKNREDLIRVLNEGFVIEYKGYDCFYKQNKFGKIYSKKETVYVKESLIESGRELKNIEAKYFEEDNAILDYILACLENTEYSLS